MNIVRLGWAIGVVAGLISVAGAASAQDGHRLREFMEKRRGQNAGEQPAPVPGTQVVQLTSGGETRTYRLHVPGNLRGPAPLMISLHGLNSNAAKQEQLSRFSQLADAGGFIVAYPEGLDQRWRMFGRTSEDTTFIADVIDDIARRSAVDRKRIMVNGISNGAQMSWRFSCDRPELVAAAGFVSGGYPDACPGKSHPPTMIFHGTADKMLPYDGRGGQMPVPEFAAAWAGCPKDAKGTPVDTTGEATSVRLQCGNGPDVIFYTIKDKGHSWPGSTMPAQITTQEVDASKEMAAFLKAR